MSNSAVALAYTFSLASFLPSLLLPAHIRSLPWGMFLGMVSALVGGISPILAVSGLIGTVLGHRVQSKVATTAGLVGTGLALDHWWKMSHSSGVSDAQFAQAFGPDWKQKLENESERKDRYLPWRWQPLIPLASEEPKWERDLVYHEFSETGRKLLFDLWTPPSSVAKSGMAIIYVHGSAWFLLDKDMGTRNQFRRLASLGHVCMDISYRLCPEVGVVDMVGDVKRATAWIKRNADRLGVRADRVVLMGASAGAHVSLLAAYNPENAKFTPSDLLETDLSVCGVVSFYGPTDLFAYWNHTNQEQFASGPKVAIGTYDPEGFKKNTMYSGRTDILLGGRPTEVPEAYEFASPITYARKECPPTLQIQGDWDVISSVHSARELHWKLVQAGAASLILVLPGMNHAFDIFAPRTSPAVQSAYHDLERFLALLI